MLIRTPEELAYSCHVFRRTVRRLRGMRRCHQREGWTRADSDHVLAPTRTFLIGVLEDIREAKRRGIRLAART
jgi:hypothetical protein